MSEASGKPSSFLARVSGFLNASGEAPRDTLEPKETVLTRQTANSTLTPRFLVILGLACVIASLGLMGDSAVTVIGAMLIAPLMKPIMAFAYGVVIGRGRLMARSLITLSVGIAVTVLVSAGTERLFGLHETTSEILARTEPSLIDLGVAVAAGIAATLAVTRPSVAEAIPGVAIAVALVPPLCVTGIGLSLGSSSVVVGSFMLFLVNLAAIILCAGMVFLIDGYGGLRRAWLALALIAGVIVALSPSLAASMKRFRIDDMAQGTIEAYLREHYAENRTVHPNDLRRLDVLLFPDHVFAFVEIEAPPDAFTTVHYQEMRDRIAAQLDLPLNLKVQTVLTKEEMLYPHTSEEGKHPDYGADQLVPRR